MLSCKEATRLVSESLDRELPVRQRLSLRFHLMMCYLCRRYRKQLHFLRSLMRLYGEEEEGAAETGVADRTGVAEGEQGPVPVQEEAVPGLSPTTRQRIRDRLRGEQSS